MKKVALYIQVAELRKNNLTPSEVRKRLRISRQQYGDAIDRARLNGLLEPAKEAAKPGQRQRVAPIYIRIAQLKNGTEMSREEIIKELNITPGQYDSSQRHDRNQGVVKRRAWPDLPADAFQDNPRIPKKVRLMTTSEAMAIAYAHDSARPVQTPEARRER